MWVRDLNAADVAYVVANMRQGERGEAEGYPAGAVGATLSGSNFGWVCGADQVAVAVIGLKLIGPGVFVAYMVATDDFGRIALSVAKFIRQDLIPTLRAQGVREVYTNGRDKISRSWLSFLGARQQEGGLWVWS